MPKKNKTPATPPGTITLKVPDLAKVNRRFLAGVKWPSEVKTLLIRPERPIEKQYETLLRNIPPEYKVRLSYYAAKREILLPAAPPDTGAIKIKPFSSRTELEREYRQSFFSDFLKLYFPRRVWEKEYAASMEYFKKMRLEDAFRVVKGKTGAGLMLLLDWRSEGKPLTLVGWIWVRKTLTANERRQVQRLMLSWLRSRMKPLAAAGVDGFNAASQGFFRKSGFTMRKLSLSKDRQSLAAAPGIMPYLDWAGTYKAAWKAVEDADYKRAMSVLTPAYRKYPRDFKVAKTYAMALGDYADTLSGARRKALKRRSCAMLGRLVKGLGRIRWEWNISARNEYYYHSSQFDKQYALGREAAEGGRQWGHYGQGVGAANYAYRHAAAGRRGLAALWARRAVAAWENFFRFKADYYNAYVHYALALGILGRAKDMEAALKKSAGLSGKPDSYLEFAEVRTKISKLSGRP